MCESVKGRDDGLERASGVRAMMLERVPVHDDSLKTAF